MATWELKRVYAPFNLQQHKPKRPGERLTYPYADDKTAAAYAEADRLASEGWELVSVSTLIAGHEFSGVGGIGSWSHGHGGGMSFTSGLIIWFKRRVDS